MPNAQTFTNTQLQTTINSYLYVQYADDDNLQAFFAAYNQATQYYLDWFNSINLPIYPYLSGDMLDWIAAGVYGITRTALASPVSPTTGPLNTLALNTQPLNYFAFPVNNTYQLTDDLFQRMITWDFYKGDGNRFSIPWLKRRIMRFLAWPNGIDPPEGPENTSAISVQISGGNVAVQINQALISVLIPDLLPGIIAIFKAAFEGRVLDLPAQFLTYSVNAVTQLVATISPNGAQAFGNTGSLTTNSVTGSPQFGSGSYTYAWTWQTGGTGITITSPTAASTTFSAAGLTAGSGVSGTALLTVTDTVTSQTAMATVAVALERSTAVVVATTPVSISVLGGSSPVVGSITAVNVSGGVPPYVSYLWTWFSGGSGISITSPTTKLTNFSAALAAGGSATGTAQLTVTDSLGSTGTANVPVSLQRSNTPTASASPTTLSVTGASSTETTASTTITVSGGQAPYNYSWAWAAGGTSITITSPTSATTTFSSTGLTSGTTRTGTAQCTVTDALGQTTSAQVGVTIIRVSAVTATVSPTTESSTGIATTQSTGIATVTPSGGQAPYNYAWTWNSGGSHITINSPTSASTSFTGSTMVNGNVYSGVAQCVVTDAFGQTVTKTVSVAFNCLAVLYTTTNTSGTSFAIPTGTSTMVVEGWGPGGTGGVGFYNAVTEHGRSGGGGQAGGYFKRTITGITSASWGKTINISATTPNSGTLTVNSGTFSITTMTAQQGGGGGNASSTVNGAAGSGAGAASGGTTNTTGANGTAGAADSLGGVGGIGTTGTNGGPFGGGKQGGAGDGSGTAPGTSNPAAVVIKVS